MQSYEVEIKSLLGNEEESQRIREALKEADPSSKLLSANKQLNHYFHHGSLERLVEALAPSLNAATHAKLKDIVARAKDSSVRTRDKDGEVLIVVKVSVGDDTSSNGVARMEFEEKVAMLIDELDKLVLSAGFTYQAKWSREREEYVCKGINVTLDKNAGYGWLAEFELVVDDEKKVPDANHTIRNLMQELLVSELPQDRLERMFAYYNAHWPEYYGTDKVFTIE